MHIRKHLNLEKELLIMCCIENKDKEIKQVTYEIHTKEMQPCQKEQQVQIKTCIIPLSFLNKCYLFLSSTSCKAQISWQW